MAATFTLPPPNPPDRPPAEVGSYAIWHRYEGLLRARFDGGWWRVSRSCEGEREHDLRARDILGWWPDPKPIPDHRVSCGTCDAYADLQPIPGGNNFGQPAYDLEPLNATGWGFNTYTALKWCCPTCSVAKLQDHMRKGD